MQMSKKIWLGKLPFDFDIVGGILADRCALTELQQREPAEFAIQR